MLFLPPLPCGLFPLPFLTPLPLGTHYSVTDPDHGLRCLRVFCYFLRSLIRLDICFCSRDHGTDTRANGPSFWWQYEQKGPDAETWDRSSAYEDWTGRYRSLLPFYFSLLWRANIPNPCSLSVEPRLSTNGEQQHPEALPLLNNVDNR